MAVPNIFGSATAAIPLSQLDTNFATPVTIGNTAVQLGNTVTSFGNVTLTNVTISSGNVTVTSPAIFPAGSNTAPSITTTGDTNTGIFFPAADTIAFSEGGAEAMRIDSSGNLGLGVTPSAWNSQWVAQDFKGASAIFAFNTTTDPALISGVNVYVDGASSTASAKYKVSSEEASMYRQYQGVHAWFTAPSGTAGNAISWTQAMTLDASGNLGIGTSSPTTKLEVAGNNTGAANNTLRLTDTATNTAANQQIGKIEFFSSDTSTPGAGVKAYIGAFALDATPDAYLAFATDATTGTPIERMRIDSNGNLLVGATTTQGGGASVFSNGGSSTNPLQVQNTNAATPYGAYFNFSAAAPNNTVQYFLTCSDTGAARAIIRSNGGLENYSANNVNLSDRREKTNFAPAGEYLAKICAIPVQTFNYIDQNLEEDGGLTLGVVAQDVQAVAPELVMESNWAKDGDDPKMRLSIYQTDLQYALMKCIQEQQAIITQLQADVAALKNPT